MKFKLPKTPAVYVKNKSFRLAQVDPEDITPFAHKPDEKEEASPRLQKLRKRLSELQESLYAEHTRSLLIVLQAMDTGGKDGAIENLFTGVNPVGVQVATFKAPTSEELKHDFLWRVHAETPKQGHIGVFNRSHYEDVLITRVHGLIDKETCKQRYEDINNFE
jgi:polyphosphate kinase 2 (PPK2 family)